MTKWAQLAAISGVFALAFVGGSAATAPLTEGAKSTLVAAGARRASRRGDRRYL
jgi:hypothetical protein